MKLIRLDIRDLIFVAGVGFLMAGWLWVGSLTVAGSLLWAWRKA